jgi:hypothetical protein
MASAEILANCRVPKAFFRRKRTVDHLMLPKLLETIPLIGRLLAPWDVRAARDLAWDFADHLRNLNGFPRQFALVAQDQVTGVLGRTLVAL